MRRMSVVAHHISESVIYKDGDGVLPRIHGPPSELPFERFVKYTFWYLKASRASLALTYEYFCRIQPLYNGDEFSALVACFMLATKYVDDYPRCGDGEILDFANYDRSADVDDIERYVLQKLDYSLFTRPGVVLRQPFAELLFAAQTK